MNAKRKYNKYINYQLTDFLSDESYQDYIASGKQKNRDFWTDFLSSYPEKQSVLKRAEDLLNGISFNGHFLSEKELEQMYAEHQKQVAELDDYKVVPFRRTGGWIKIAAVFAGITLVILAVIFSSRNSRLIAKTEFGKMERVLLPDSSMVVLNANSKIEYPKKWKDNKKREVWLEGEAFFEVKHLNTDPAHVSNHDEFVLHTSNLLIEVLGTSFDVRQRREKTEVVLQTGKIKITFVNGKHESLILNPGDAVTYDANTGQVERSVTNPENYTGWREHKLMLMNPTVTEIVQYLEDNYGRKIVLQSPELGEKKIEGPILLNNLDDALFILSTVLKSDIIQKDSVYYIHARR